MDSAALDTVKIFKHPIHKFTQKIQTIKRFCIRVMPPKVALRATDTVDPGQTVLRSVCLITH